MLFTLGESVQLSCEYFGLPSPQIEWYKNDQRIDDETDKRFIFQNNSTMLNITFALEKDEGRYICIVTNNMGQVSREVTLKIRLNDESSIISKPYIYILSAGIILFLIATYFLIKRKRNKRNDELPMPPIYSEVPFNLTTRDRKYEIPRENLRIGNRLGSGEFGVVMEGFLKRTSPGKKMEETRVAVKMLKPDADNQVNNFH